MGNRYRHVSIEERCEIARLRAEGKSLRQVAAAVDRAQRRVLEHRRLQRLRAERRQGRAQRDFRQLREPLQGRRLDLFGGCAGQHRHHLRTAGIPLPAMGGRSISRDVPVTITVSVASDSVHMTSFLNFDDDMPWGATSTCRLRYQPTYWGGAQSCIGCANPPDRTTATYPERPT